MFEEEDTTPEEVYNSLKAEKGQRLRSAEIVASIADKGLLTAEERQKAGVKEFRSSITFEESRSRGLEGAMVARFGQKGIKVVNLNRDPQELFSRLKNGDDLKNDHPYYVRVSVPGDKRYINMDWAEKDDVNGQEFTDKLIYRGLYGNNSVFTILAEREWHSEWSEHSLTRDEPTEILEDRFRNSLLVVVRTDSVDNWVLPDTNVIAKKRIESAKFLEVVIPKDLSDDIARLFEEKGVKVTRVGYKDVVIFKDNSANPPERVLEVPDYEGRVLELVQRSDVPLYLHGVRLPTKEDILS